MTSEFILKELQSVASEEKAAHLMRFFKTGKGQYGEGDLFFGIVVPIQRNIAKANKATPLTELSLLLKNKYHEARLVALLILIEKYKKANDAEKEELHNFYLNHTSGVNNWDLVDLSCPTIVGDFLLDKDRSVLFSLAESNNMWEQRIAVVSTMTLIRKSEFSEILLLAKKLMDHKHDLMHKAIGWMLREMGKKSRETLTDFLEEYTTRMPRTMLRYAIEHYPEDQRLYFLKKK
jgi:Predicted DNA alkylation repair enzyme